MEQAIVELQNTTKVLAKSVGKAVIDKVEVGERPKSKTRPKPRPKSRLWSDVSTATVDTGTEGGRRGLGFPGCPKKTRIFRPDRM
jgi:hypothetical protein